MTATPCPRCDRVDCPLATATAAFHARQNHVNSRALYAAEGDCEAHAVDWRAEALRLGPVVAAAEAWRDSGRYGRSLKVAIDTFRSRKEQP